MLLILLLKGPQPGEHFPYLGLVDRSAVSTGQTSLGFVCLSFASCRVGAESCTFISSGEFDGQSGAAIVVKRFSAFTTRCQRRFSSESFMNPDERSS
jgi:hypothetical protein